MQCWTVAIAILAIGLEASCSKNTTAVTPDNDGDTMTRTCQQPEGADATGSDRLEDGDRGTASVVIEDRDSCYRSYRLSSTAILRDSLPGNPREYSERQGDANLRSGNDMFDALYALALEEVRELSVDAIRDGAFNNGASVACGQGGCFETGRKWNYVWTRDTAYAVDLGLSAVDALRARNSLAFKLSPRRTGGGSQIVQDTGSGGSYPVSTDRVSWALGAWALLQNLEGSERTLFRDTAYQALVNTLEHDRRLVWDPADGLYRGEQSFLDWREQSYPEWTATDVVHIAMSKALGTNLLHMRALEIARALAEETGDASASQTFAAQASALRQAIQEHFWLEEEGQFSSFMSTGLDPSATRRYDLLASSLAILFDVASPEQAQRILSGYPHYGPGAPVMWPQQQDTPIYHNRGEWPFVSAYWLRAAAHADHEPVANRMVRALIRGAAINLSNMENFEAATGLPYLEEGVTSGPVVNSQRQLWSVAGYLSMVHSTLFGLQPGPAGLEIKPYITSDLRRELFAGTDSIVLNDYQYKGKRLTVVAHLPAAGEHAGAYQLQTMQLNERPHEGAVQSEDLSAETNLLEVWLAPPASAATRTLTERSALDWRAVFGPRSPRISSLVKNGGALELGVDLRNNDPAQVRLHVYRDGVRVAEDLPGTTSTWTDTGVSALASSSYCYAVELSFSSGNFSQHSPPLCWWRTGNSAIQRIVATDLVNVGGQPSSNYGRAHYQDWGDPGHQLIASDVVAASSGIHLVQVEYGNGAGSITSGITCAIKRVRVEDQASGALVGQGTLVMPHLGSWERWSDSNFVPVSLSAGKTYRITIESDPSYANMSSFEHFAQYTAGLGGSDGEFNRVNISELRLLAR